MGTNVSTRDEIWPAAAACGSWRSPISASLISEATVRLSAPSLVGGDVYWVEGRPAEAGRQVLVRLGSSGSPEDVTPDGFNVRTRVHEYGGGTYVVSGTTVYFSNFTDQRLYRQELHGQARAITPEPATGTGMRYADGRVTGDGRWIVCVRESHERGSVTNELVAVPTDGTREQRVLASGHDFYSSPRLSPDGRQLAWLSWDHPRMPWDGTELWLARLEGDLTVQSPRRAAGRPEESIVQPEWGPDGSLFFCSDRTGWWNIYRFAGEAPEQILAMDAEFSGPQWTFDLSTYGLLADGRIVCRWSSKGVDHLGILDLAGGLERIEQPYTAISSVRADGDDVVFIGASPEEEPAVVRLRAGGEPEVLRRSRERAVDSGYLSTPRPIEFPTGGGLTAHALYYEPANREFSMPEAERPPLLVTCHGGPTSASRSSLDLQIQYWTSRGIAVVDVNYGGSTGHGRDYRERLRGQWGVVDVDDCVNAALFLVGQGEVDGRRLAIRGGSAGGWTTLCALTFRDTFGAGASYYGVADAEALARETHKFESRYLDGLIGPYPEARDLYVERSPIHHTDRLSGALIVFQGLDDPIVPPNQAETMVAALKAKGLPHAYVAFEGEQHGFRRSDTIRRCLEAELSFYSQVFRFPISDPIPPVEIQGGEFEHQPSGP